MNRLELFINELQAADLSCSDIAAFICSGDIALPDWIATQECTEHIKLIDLEDGQSGFNLGFIRLDYE